MSSMHSVKQRENKEALALSSSGTNVPELATAMSGHVPLSIKLQQLRRRRSPLPLAVSTAETAIAAEATVATIGAIIAPSGSRPTARALVGQRACAARPREAADGSDDKHMRRPRRRS